MELPAKMLYDAQLWATVNKSLYWVFAFPVGAIIELGAIVSTILLLFLVRKHPPAFRLTLIATVCLTVAFFGVWIGFVAPMNAQVEQWTVGSVPADWTRIRNQWEYSHAIRFVLHLIGFSALLLSVLRETPKGYSRHPIVGESTYSTRH
ncbi:MAG: DUF1772 domain-containing protein [Lyngbya sp.]|nr:DUF1772 domain-containing protein [Lyngbya sp.]